MKPETVAKAMHEAANQQLGLHIFAADGAHVGASSLGSEVVHGATQSDRAEDPICL